jgi:hypothetical protein
MDQRELLKNFYLFIDVTSNDLQALEAIVERERLTSQAILYTAREKSRMCCRSWGWGEWT